MDTAKRCDICGATVMPGGVRTSMGGTLSHAAAVARWCQYARQRPDLHGEKQCANPCSTDAMDPTETFEARSADLTRRIDQTMHRMTAEFSVAPAAGDHGF